MGLENLSLEDLVWVGGATWLILLTCLSYVLNQNIYMFPARKLMYKIAY